MECTVIRMLTRHSLVLRLTETNAVIEAHLTHELSNSDLARARMLTAFRTAKGFFRPTEFKMGVFLGELEIDFPLYSWARSDYKRKKYTRNAQDPYSPARAGVPAPRGGPDQPGERHGGVQEPGCVGGAG
ncbi:MAG: hypothetical protein EBR81_16835 [Proteobacteria bacterium]|nr:hypothetical protein [Pseudomonadota bacterium]